MCPAVFSSQLNTCSGRRVQKLFPAPAGDASQVGLTEELLIRGSFPLGKVTTPSVHPGFGHAMNYGHVWNSFAVDVLSSWFTIFCNFLCSFFCLRFLVIQRGCSFNWREIYEMWLLQTSFRPCLRYVLQFCQVPSDFVWYILLTNTAGQSIFIIHY